MSDEDPTIPLKPVRDFKIKVGKFIIDRSYNSKKEAMSKQNQLIIKQITLVTEQGVAVYQIDKNVTKINEEDIYINGDPFSHYVGRNDDGEILFTINRLIPCVVEYLKKKP